MERKKRILIGVEDICGQIGDYKQGYEAEGHHVFTFVLSRPNFYTGNYSFVLNDLYFQKLLNTNNLLLILLRKFYSFLVVHPLFYFVFFFQLLRCDICQLMWIPHKRWKYMLPVVNWLNKKLILTIKGW